MLEFMKCITDQFELTDSTSHCISSKFNFFDASEGSLMGFILVEESPLPTESLGTDTLPSHLSRFNSGGKADNFNFGTTCVCEEGKMGCAGLVDTDGETALDPHSSLGTLTIDSLGRPSICSSSLLSLINLHFTELVGPASDI